MAKGTTLEKITERLAAREPLDGAALVTDPVRGDPVLEEGESGNPRPAAVLVPIRLHREGPSLLFMLRPMSMKVHPGQISFPGGGKSHRDSDAAATALREAKEEIGLGAGQAELVGRLPPYRTTSNYRVTPVVALVDPAFKPRLDSREVEETFEAPVAFFLKKDSLQVRAVREGGRKRTFFAFQYRDRFIWGATAAILVNLVAALKAYARG